MKIGIVGASGDLGSQLAIQALSKFDEVFLYDIDRRATDIANGVNPAVLAADASGNATWTADLSELLNSSDIIHWAAPIEAAQEVTSLTPDKTLVFHASVMHDSERAIESLKRIKAQLRAVHCLMNQNGTVVVANDFGDTAQIVQHIVALGLKPTPLSVAEHDHAMAISQAPIAILHTLLAGELDELDAKNLLTPSGHDFKVALTRRAANWTPATLRSILGNPEIPNLINRMNEMTKN